MAYQLSCLKYNVYINTFSYQSSNSQDIRSLFPTAEWNYYIQYADCCYGGVTNVRKLSDLPGWDITNESFIFFYNDFINWGVPPIVYVQRISNGEIRSIPPYEYDANGFVSISQQGNFTPICTTTTVTPRTTIHTTTKAPLNFVFKSACEGITHSTMLNSQFWQKVICLQQPLQSVWTVGSTNSTLIPSNNWTSYFLGESSSVVSSGCNCNCATQSLPCTKIRVSSAVPKTFRYVDCATGLVDTQILKVGSWNITQKPTLISVPTNCLTSIPDSFTTVNFRQSQGYVDTPSCTGYQCYDYNGPYGFLMSSTNSQYTAPVSGNYTIDANIRMMLTTSGNYATNSVNLSLKRKKSSDGSILTLFNEVWFSQYSDSGQYGYTVSISGGGIYGLSASDKVYLEIKKSPQLISATYTSMVCSGGQNLYLTSLGLSNSQQVLSTVQNFTSNPRGIGGPFRLSFPSNESNWNGYDYTSGYAFRDFTFGWTLSVSYVVTSSTNVKSFSIDLVPLREATGFAVYDRKTFTIQGGVNLTGNTTFEASDYQYSLYTGEKANLSLFVSVREPISQVLETNITVEVTLNDGSIFTIYSAGDWVNSSRQGSYFEVSDAPWYSSNPTSYGYTFCVRTPLQNQPPIQSIGVLGTFSACQTPGTGIYFPACNPALSLSDCGNYVRSNVEIFGTSCTWPGSPVAPTTTIGTYNQPVPPSPVFNPGNQINPSAKCTGTCDRYFITNADPELTCLVTWTECSGLGSGSRYLFPNESFEICACGMPIDDLGVISVQMGMRSLCTPEWQSVPAGYSCSFYSLTPGNRAVSGQQPYTQFSYFECDSNSNPGQEKLRIVEYNQAVCAVDGTVRRVLSGNGTFSLYEPGCDTLTNFLVVTAPQITFGSGPLAIQGFNVSLLAYRFSNVGSININLNHENLVYVTHSVHPDLSSPQFNNNGTFSSLAWSNTNPVNIADGEALLSFTFTGVGSSRLQFMFSQTNNCEITTNVAEKLFTRFFDGFVKFPDSSLPAYTWWSNPTAITTLPPPPVLTSFVVGKIHYNNNNQKTPITGTVIEIWGSYSALTLGHSISSSESNGQTISPWPGNTPGAVLMRTVTPNSSGNFSFSVSSGFLDTLTYSIRVISSKAWGGVTPTDSLVCSRHILSYALITNPLRLRAADVNSSDTITTGDSLLISRRANGSITGFNSGNWIFWVNGLSSLFKLNELTGSVATGFEMNIIGNCVGDLNSSYVPPQ